jgi:type IV secretory pathway component VirB8
MLGRPLPKHRQFSYKPQYYDPNKDEKEKRRKRIKFKRVRSKSSAKARSWLWLLFIVAFVIYIIAFLNRYSHK